MKTRSFDMLRHRARAAALAALSVLWVGLALFSPAGACEGPGPFGPGVTVTQETQEDGCKPSPGVTVTWEAREALVPGRIAATEIRLSSRFAVESVRLSVRIPAGIEVLDPLPAYDGRPAPGETLAFPLRIRVPDGRSPLLEARVEVRSDRGDYRVGTALDPTPPQFLTLAARGGKTVSTLTGDLVQFNAVRIPGSATAAPPRSGAMAAPVETVILEGHFFYRDRVLGADGFIYASYPANPLKPVRRADVELLQVVGAAETVIATTATDLTGAFSFSVPGAPGDTYRVRAVSRSDAWGGALVRIRQSAAVPTFYGAASATFQKPASGTQVGDFIIEPELGGEAFNILDSCLEGAFTVEELEGSLPGQTLNVYWNAGSAAGTYFSRSQWAIYLLADEGYDDSVIIHEYGHYVAWLYSKDDSFGGAHYVEDSAQDVRLSWSEGWASYFQSAVRARAGDPYPSWYVDTWGTPGSGQLYFAYDAEPPTFAVRGTGSEVAVHAVLWDIEDGPDTPDSWPGVDDDPLNLSRALTWEVVTGPLTSAFNVSLEDFWEGWFSPAVNNGHRPEMETTFAALGAEYFPDALEADGTGGLAKETPLDGTPQHHSFYPEGDQDYQRFTAEAGDRITVETLNVVGFGDTYLEIIDPNLAVVGTSSNRSADDLSSLVAFTAGMTGTYLAHVRREYSTSLSALALYGSYDLRAMRGIAKSVAMTPLSASSGVANTGYGVGAAWADYDLDSRPDLYLVNNTAAVTYLGPATAVDALYRNLGGGAFSNVTTSAQLGSSEGNVGAAWGDYDNDGYPDLFVSDHGLYRNLGNGKFLDVTAASGVSDIGREFDAAWVDADSDGLLDLFVLRRDGPSALWHNNGGGTFSDVAGVAGFNFPSDGGNAYGCAWGDFDGDRRADLFMAHLGTRGHALYRNLGDNQFEDVTEAAGVASSVAASGGAWGDVNNDGLLDLFVASNGANALYINQGGGVFVNEAARYGVNDPNLAIGAGFADYDLDGDLDLYVVNVSAVNLLYQNLGGAMLRVNQAGDDGAGYGCAWGDMDGDGDPDLYLTRGCSSSGCQPNILYRNFAADGAAPTWLKVSLRGQDSNRDGIGALIMVHAEGLIQTRQMGTGGGWASKSLLPETFGFPAGTEVDSVEVFWPSGYYNVARNPGLGSTLMLVEDTSTPVLPPAEAPPFSVTLRAPAPNPFSRATTASFTLTQSAEVRVEIFDLAGRRLRVLMDRRLEAGDHVVGWDGEDGRGRTVAPGVYFYRLAADDRVEVRKLVRVGG
jgi:hypothetical protein